MGVAAFYRRSVMEQSTFPISRDVSLKCLVTDALGEIKRLGYSRRSRGRYRATWEHLIEFCGRNGLGDQFSGELAVRFLEEYRITGDEHDMSGEGWRRHIVWGGKVLAVKAAAWIEDKRRLRPSIWFRPCRIHFVTTKGTVRTASISDRRRLTGVRQNSRSS